MYKLFNYKFNDYKLLNILVQHDRLSLQ